MANATLPITCEFTSPLGRLVAAAADDALIGLWFVDQRHFPKDLGAWRRGQTPELAAARAEVAAYFAGELRVFSVPLRPRGTPFQQSVWTALRKIPYGELQIYGDVARQLGRPSATRAVGAATGRNPVGIIIPCHRLVGADGSLTGYAGGLSRKRALLEGEGGDRPIFGNDNRISLT